VPIITISRGTMSGGQAVAERLAGILGYPCIGREILQEAAAKVGVSEHDLREQFETPPSRWARLNEKRTKYVLAVQAALAEHCAQGSLVYHGLAGQFLLRGIRGVIRVRLIAPLEKRVQSLMDAHHRLTPAAAEEFIHHVDHDRRRWVKSMYGIDVEDPSLYDLTINLHFISIETASEIIAVMAGQPQYQLTDEVKAELQVFASSCRQKLAEANFDH